MWETEVCEGMFILSMFFQYVSYAAFFKDVKLTTRA